MEQLPGNIHNMRAQARGVSGRGKGGGEGDGMIVVVRMHQADGTAGWESVRQGMLAAVRTKQPVVLRHDGGHGQARAGAHVLALPA